MQGKGGRGYPKGGGYKGGGKGNAQYGKGYGQNMSSQNNGGNVNVPRTVEGGGGAVPPKPAIGKPEGGRGWKSPSGQKRSTRGARGQRPCKTRHHRRHPSAPAVPFTLGGDPLGQ